MAFLPRVLNWIETLRLEESSLEDVFALTMTPHVTLVDPPLQGRDGRKPPHLYKGDFLCLYLPNSGEWNGQMFLARTIIPWTSEWLLHYEIWLATGEWHGGGIHPPGGKKKPA
jgi:hypothetical protein